MCICNFWSLIALTSAVVQSRNVIQSDLAMARNVGGSASAVEISAKHLHDTPQPPSTHQATPLPANVEEIVTDCLAKESDHRPARASILREQPTSCADANSLSGQNARDR
jgi:hypothetical protein